MSRLSTVIRKRLLSASTLLLTFAAAALFAGAQVVSVGAGSYTTALPSGATAPQATHYTTYSGPVATHKFWTAKNWYPLGDTSSGGAYYMFPEPLSVYTGANGLTLGYYGTVNNNGTWFNKPYEGDLTVGVAGLNASAVNVTGFSDWAATMSWGPSFSATMGRGMPFVYVTTDGSNPTVSFAGTPTVFANNGNILGVSIANNNYGLFCPTGGSWSGLSGTTFTCNLPSGHDYFSLAVLPSQAALSDYSNYAFSFPTNTQVSWSYNPATSQVSTTFTVTTQAQEGSNTGFVMALYPHQYASLSGSSINTNYTYASPRGTLEVMEANSFTTVNTFHGILPFLPPTGNYNTSTLQSDLGAVTGEGNHFTDNETYGLGKQLNRIAQLLFISHSIGDTTDYNGFLSSLESEYQSWFNAGGGKTTDLFYYDTNWGTMIGYPASYGTDTSLNDHHFHYGYWIHAAALTDLFDPNFLTSSNYGGMVDLLARDIAEPNRGDSMFPFLRYFDVYGGHSWAAGQAPFGDGGNEESSSEAVNAWAGLILYGAATGNTQVEDEGIWLYTLETNAVRDYWFNDGPVKTFPAGFSYLEIANVFDAKSDTGTWFSSVPDLEHDIEFLPFTGGSLYLGRDAAYCQNNFDEILSEDNESALATGSTNWPDLTEEYQAFFDPTSALSEFNNTSYVFDGETKAHEYYWMSNLQSLGEVDDSITANAPLYAVFKNQSTGVVTHVAFNPSTSPITVSFSDGYNLNVPAGSLADDNGSWSTSGGSTGPSAPSAPSNLSATAASSSQINLSWTASSTSGVTYTVFRSTASGFSPSSSNQIAAGVSGTSYSDTGLAASTAYYYLVEAVNSAGSSSPTNQASATTQSGSSGGGGTSEGNTLYVIGGATQSAASTLSFAAGTNAVSDTIPADNGTNYDGTPNNPLVYVIKNVNGTYNSAASLQFNLYVDSGTGVGNGVQVEVLYDLNGTGTWNYTQTYHYFATDNVSGWQDYTQSSGVESTSGTPGNLSNGTIEIEVWNAIGTSPGYLNASATAAQGSQSTLTLPYTSITWGGGSTGSTPPSAPSGLSAAAASSSQINLSWSASATSGVSYTVFRSTTSGFSPSSSNQIASGVSGTSYSDTGLSAATTYYYVVEAADASGSSAASNQASATTQSAASSCSGALPGGWSNEDIGSPALAGCSGFASDTFTVTGAGSDIWNTSDQFQFASTALTGDGQIVAQVASQTNTDPWAKAGVMMRETTAADASFVAVEMTPGNGVTMQARNGTGASAVVVGSASATVPQWVKLIRSGNTFTGYYSADRSTWTALGSITVSMASGIQAGLAVTSHNTGATSTATFSSVGVKTPLAVSINGGGGAAGAFIADADYSGGNTASTGNTIDTSLVAAPVPPQAVFQTERWGASTYTIGGFEPATPVTVKLYFAEIYWSTTGQREFNVIINGTQVLTNFDIIAAAGAANKAIEENFSTNADANGNVTVQFTVGAADQPKISGMTLTGQPQTCGRMNGNQELLPGEIANSCDGRFTLTEQPDGNLVLYQGTSALWAAGTSGQASVAAIMQADGNFVEYTNSGANWATSTSGNAGAYLSIQNDGNLVVYNSSGSPLWASNTCCH